jgi:hypothetical protein
VRYLIGRDAATLAKSLATPGPRPELEKLWRRTARKHNRAIAAQKRKLKKEAEYKQQQLPEQRALNGAPMVKGSGGDDGEVYGSVKRTAAEVVDGGCKGAPKSVGVKKQCMLNTHVLAKNKTG